MIPFENVMSRFFLVVGMCAAVALAGSASAQQVVPGIDNVISEKQQRVGESHYTFEGGVEIKLGTSEIYADKAELFNEQDRALLTGNVVFVQGANRIAAERADFNTKTRLGTFYNATGIATLQPQRQTPRPGAIAPPPLTGQDTDVYFYGDTVEKIGPKKYKITNGGFTTCVQPTPRWMLTSKTVVLNLDHYTLLRDAVLSVKGVPMFYTPILYYPTKREDRATGFLLPTYGSSTIRGHSLHDAFFWAINRSQDATFLHDWFSKTGQGMGSEYRYNFAAGSDGNIRTYLLNETLTPADGTTGPTSSSRSYELRGSANQLLPGGLHARARVDYFSSLTTMQSFNTNIYDTSRNQRSFGGNVVGAWSSYSFNSTVDHTEYFYPTGSGITGSWPRVALTRNERPLWGTQLYFSAGGEYASLLQDSKDTSQNIEVDRSLTRLDFTPQIRFPFKKWQWFTVNSSLNWRDTYYTRSVDPDRIDPATNRGTVVDDGLNRRFFTVQAQIVGPVFNRIWDTPTNGYAEKFKHSVEPYLNLQRTSSIDNYPRIVTIDGTDSIVGGTTQYNYGVTNRFYAKQRDGQRSQAREILDVQVDQTYYTNSLASQVDQRYSTSFNGFPDPNATPSNFSPIALSVRALPTNDFNSTLRAEFDSRYRSLRTISASGSYSWTGRVQSTVTWSKKAFIKDLPGFNNPDFLDQSINTSTNVHTKDNRFGGLYSFTYDVLRSNLLQQRITGFYNAQCCGIAFEYLLSNYGVGYIVPSDHRFFLSFTLAGLGNFSPFNGAMGGVPR
jgi:LPS-assembly protein